MAQGNLPVTVSGATEVKARLDQGPELKRDGINKQKKKRTSTDLEGES